MAQESVKHRWIMDLVRSYQRPLIAYARARLGDQERAHEVVQSTFQKLWEADRARIEGHVARWLYTVCRNEVTDVLRKEGRMTPVEADRLAAVPHPGDGPDERLQQKERLGRVLALVARLPERQQEVLRLRFQEGFSYREIAQVTGVSQSNVGFLLHTAIRTLRDKLRPVLRPGVRATSSR